MHQHQQTFQQSRNPKFEKKVRLASPAIALANNVLPVPGGPIKRAP